MLIILINNASCVRYHGYFSISVFFRINFSPYKCFSIPIFLHINVSPYQCCVEYYKYSEPPQTSKMKRFAKIVGSFCFKYQWMAGIGKLPDPTYPLNTWRRINVYRTLICINVLQNKELHQSCLTIVLFFTSSGLLQQQHYLFYRTIFIILRLDLLLLKSDNFTDIRIPTLPSSGGKKAYLNLLLKN